VVGLVGSIDPNHYPAKGYGFRNFDMETRVSPGYLIGCTGNDFNDEFPFKPFTSARLSIFGYKKKGRKERETKDI
jgi:hypothetical protein